MIVSSSGELLRHKARLNLTYFIRYVGNSRSLCIWAVIFYDAKYPEWKFLNLALRLLLYE